MFSIGNKFEVFNDDLLNLTNEALLENKYSYFNVGNTKEAKLISFCNSLFFAIQSGDGTVSMECPLCLADLPHEEFCELSGCGHRACLQCLQQYLRVEITESRVCISCPECSEAVHPNEIRSILDDGGLFEKYEDFMVRRVLAVDPDTRWCPAPDCR